MSSGEERIGRILRRAGIQFQVEKSFEDLGGNKYRYDFYCPSLGGRQVIFEFNGRQHYEIIKKFHKTIADFQSGQERDRRKISYALANNIKIYCIPFWEENKLFCMDDLCQEKFNAKTRWHNDQVWRKHKGEKQ